MANYSPPPPFSGVFPVASIFASVGLATALPTAAQLYQISKPAYLRFCYAATCYATSFTISFICQLVLSVKRIHTELSAVSAPAHATDAPKLTPTLRLFGALVAVSNILNLVGIVLMGTGLVALTGGPEGWVFLGVPTFAAVIAGTGWIVFRVLE